MDVVDAKPVETVKPPEADAKVEVTADAWCHLRVDGEDRGRIDPGKKKELVLRPGGHSLQCLNPSLTSWGTTVELDPGQTRRFNLSLLPRYQVKIGLTGGDAARIGDQLVKRGASIRLKRNRYRVQILKGGKAIRTDYLDLVKDCTLDDSIACK